MLKHILLFVLHGGCLQIYRENYYGDLRIRMEFTSKEGYISNVVVTEKTLYTDKCLNKGLNKYITQAINYVEV